MNSPALVGNVEKRVDVGKEILNLDLNYFREVDQANETFDYSTREEREEGGEGRLIFMYLFPLSSATPPSLSLSLADWA